MLWTDTEFSKIYGTVIYDLDNSAERQDSVWYMTEFDVLSDDVKKLLEFLSKNNLIDIDKIITPINELNIDFIDKNKLEGVWNDPYLISKMKND